MAMMPTVVLVGDAPAMTEARELLAPLPMTIVRKAESAPEDTDIAIVAMSRADQIGDAVRCARIHGLARRIVVFSAAGSTEHLVTAAAAGADGWMRPGVPAETYARTLEGVHRGESGFSRLDAMRLIDAVRSAPGPASAAGGDVTLTPREHEIQQSLRAGSTTRDIARRLSISEGTVRWHAARAQRKQRAGRLQSTGVPVPAQTSGSHDRRPAPAPSRSAAAEARTPITPIHQTAQGLSVLGRAELRVAILVAEGLSNPEIATRLFISRHTVESHLKQIFVKLGVRSRVELTRRVLASSVRIID